MQDKEDERDQKLIRKVQVGDREAFAEIVRIYQNSLIGSAYQMLGNIEDAREISQETFLRVWKYAKSFRGEAKFRTWMISIMRNLIFTETAKRKRRMAKVMPTEMDEERANFSTQDWQQPDKILSFSQTQRAIQTAIETLPEKQRLCLILLRFENMSYDEIAGVMGLSSSAVKSQIFRARQRLKILLKDYR